MLYRSEEGSCLSLYREVYTSIITTRSYFTPSTSPATLEPPFNVKMYLKLMKTLKRADVTPKNHKSFLQGVTHRFNFFFLLPYFQERS